MLDNIHDQRRRMRVIKTLLKAKEQTSDALLYLEGNKRSLDEIEDTRLAMEHINIALKRLGYEGEMKENLAH